MIDETQPLPREADPQWRIFRFSEIEKQINTNQGFDRDLDSGLKLNKACQTRIEEEEHAINILLAKVLKNNFKKLIH